MGKVWQTGAMPHKCGVSRRSGGGGRQFAGLLHGESSTIGDLDIAIDLVPKEPDSRKHSERLRAYADAAALCGKRFGNFVQRLDFAAKEVRSYLKARSRIIQLTGCDDGVLKIAEHRVIYEGPEYNPVVPKYPAPKRRVRLPRKTDDDCPF